MKSPMCLSRSSPHRRQISRAGEIGIRQQQILPVSPGGVLPKRPLAFDQSARFQISSVNRNLCPSAVPTFSRASWARRTVHAMTLRTTNGRTMCFLFAGC